jgi:hypothetical protein
MFGFLSEGSAVVISEDGSWMTVDSNPDNSSSNSPIADILTLEVVRSINDKLGFSPGFPPTHNEAGGLTPRL